MNPQRRLRGLARPKYLLSTLLVVIALGVAAIPFFSARNALKAAAGTAARNGQLAFTRRIYDAAPARSLGANWIASAPDYTAGTRFAGTFYLAGPSGLMIQRSGENSPLTLRSGFELPVAPITAVAVARMRGSGEPRLLLATAGAGLLLLGPENGSKATVEQVLPLEAPADDLTALAPLKTGEILLGTRHRGVLLYDGATLTPVRFSLPQVDPATLQVTAIAAVDSASFLVGTRDAGVFYLHAGIVEHADARSGLPDMDVETIAVSDSSGPRHAFVGTPVGTADFDLVVPVFRPVRVLAPGLFSHALAVAGDQLAVGTLDQGIRQVPFGDGATLRRTSIMAGAVPASAGRVDAFIASGDQLYALADGTLLRRNGAAWQPALPAAPAALTDRNVSALAFAPDGTLYIGYFDHGLDLLSPEGRIQHLEDDHLFCINRLALDPQRHTITVATANGLVLFDAQGRPRQTLTRRDGLVSDHITDVAFTPSGAALATPAGITFLEPSGAESLYAFQGLVNNHVYTLAQARGGQLLAGTLGGISILRANIVERNLTVNNSTLKHNWITALLPGPGKTMLVGTYGVGLETLDADGRFTLIELPAGTPRDLVINPNALFATATHIYAGTLGHGMLVYSRSSGRWTVVSSGLPSLNVTAFAARAGQIYVGTENGLLRIPEANLP